MQPVFLTAHWKNLIMANYACDKNILLPYLPANTELDLFNDTCYVSLVGFMFLNTKVMGIGFPFHRNFEEINLRFYVRYKENNVWKRGVVFIKEIVPKFMITTIANTFYNERYVTLKTRNATTTHQNNFSLSYQWKFKNTWNTLAVNAQNELTKIESGSEEEFITEHYWGYTAQKKNRTLEYAVEHPRWEMYPVIDYTISCDFEKLYGEEFLFLGNIQPISVILAKGSEVIVRKGKILS
ncbi:MAG: DUF2071 domain-containing protein [Fimbriimonadaceae bacterium]|nr:DUF2071 domain-containing protein [Chitinophagales bacterium]